MNQMPDKPRTWIGKFRCAGNGLMFAARFHNSFHVHLLVAASVIVVAVILPLELWRWCVLLMSIGGVLTAELLNTAIEELVRTLHPGMSQPIGRALDIAASAVLIASITAVTVGAIVLSPPLWKAMVAASG